MDIVTRLKKFLEQSGITNSQFADTCEIPRPTLSQLLNGRNKKVSDEVISKIHRAYPSLNVMWLMFGDGDMFVSGSTPESSPASDAPHASTAPSTSSAGVQRAISFDDIDEAFADSPATRQSRHVETAASVTDAIQNIVRSNAANGRIPASRASVSSQARRVVSLMVFYNDGTFEQFGPSH